MVVCLFRRNGIGNSHLPDGLRPGDQDVIAYDTQVQLFVSYDQVDCLPDGVVAFRDAYRFFIIDQLAVIDKEKAGLFRYFVKQAVDGIFFFG